MKINVDLTKPDKFHEAIIYVCRKCETDPRFSVTKLNKILFFADFVSFGKTGNSITGQRYQKLPHGPAPKAMLPVTTRMVHSREIEIRPTRYFGRSQKKPIAMREPVLDVFSVAEVSLIDDIIREFWNFSASEISEASHGFIGWQLADLKETIPYGLAWIDPEPNFTKEELAKISKLKPRSKEEREQLRYH